MLIFFLVALAASVAGAICGIGGGVIIKPVLDLLHLETVTAISFLSGCTVLSMSCYSVGRRWPLARRREDWREISCLPPCGSCPARRTRWGRFRPPVWPW